MNTKILEDIRSVKRRLIPNERLILFGSHARGDARTDSDWDLLILLNKPNKEISDYDNYGFPFDEIGWDYGAMLLIDFIMLFFMLQAHC
ncbi:MAG: nucleotidyltransferase domain-containing protein [Dysgonamonadaceae bacterium]|jgi:predicted nucleotidyltransferase|nr:nucleotidyltransferase domain-containing protein [Dysgonamonadaceae bacterium]